VYLLSIPLLGDSPDAPSLFFVLLGVLGACLLALGSANSLPASLPGALCVLGSSLAAALYKVLFARSFPGAGPPFVAGFLSRLGLLNLLLLWPALLLTGDPWIPDRSSLRAQSLHSLAAVSFNFCVNFGVAATSPVLISLGTLLGMPLTAAHDCLAGDACLLARPGEAAGAACVAASFAGVTWRRGRGGKEGGGGEDERPLKEAAGEEG
jgi:solute carrier family 35 protein F3/4